MTQVTAVRLADKSRMLAGFGFRTHKRPRKQVCVFSPWHQCIFGTHKSHRKCPLYQA